MAKLNDVLEINGEEFKAIRFWEEPNTGLIVVEGRRGCLFTIPTVLWDEAARAKELQQSLNAHVACGVEILRDVAALKTGILERFEKLGGPVEEPKPLGTVKSLLCPDCNIPMTTVRKSPPMGSTTVHVCGRCKKQRLATLVEGTGEG